MSGSSSLPTVTCTVLRKIQKNLRNQTFPSTESTEKVCLISFIAKREKTCSFPSGQLPTSCLILGRLLNHTGMQYSYQLNRQVG